MKAVSFNQAEADGNAGKRRPQGGLCVLYEGHEGHGVMVPRALHGWKEEMAGENGRRWGVAVDGGVGTVVNSAGLLDGGKVSVVDLLTEEECGKVIQNAEDIGFLSTQEQANPVYDYILPVNESGMLFIESQQFADSLWARLRHLFTAPLNLACTNFLAPSAQFICTCAQTPFEPFGIHPRMKILRYKPDEQFKPHQDTTVRKTEVGGKKGIFRNGYTLAIYLNTSGRDYEGGGLRFLHPPRVVPTPGAKPQIFYDDLTHPVHLTPSAGQAAIFPPQHHHTAEVVTSGTKYMIQADIMYRQPTPLP
eukprot:TRINITY_DN26331_c0_g1_i1.p1 TRINITY_DN26331_c0_g1~~TRINITY_DN26331_c0_g1_i1.p1  ORF type:complete len:306 (+),score=66.38 TRINITY_DN26331_c0_g1_i1:38-955(+)